MQINDQAFGLDPPAGADDSEWPRLTLTAPDRPAARWVAFIAAALAQHGKQRLQESVARAILNAIYDETLGVF